ncbi:MAG: acyl-CoA dehydrogenase family protein [Deltaproteobacteria bacterium]|nr:acyl-CoA dehydrogenase family protein [Deltaproteobacteria bacterium]
MARALLTRCDMIENGITAGGSFLVGKTVRDVFAYEDLSGEDCAIAEVAESFVRRDVLPQIDAIEAQTPGLMRSLLEKAGTLGLLMFDIPEQHGGLGVSKAVSTLIGERAFKLASFSIAWGAHTGIGTLPLLFYGTAEQKQRYLPRLMSGEMIAAYALTEPGSGSDALGAKTTATPTANGYRLTGVKQFITNGGFADLFTVFAKVDGEKFTAFLVERATPGVSLGPEEHKLGIKGSSTCALILEDVFVPAENLLGELGLGHKIAFNILNIGRLKLGAAALGAARECLEFAVRYASDRKQFQTPLVEFGAIQRKIADMAVRIFVADAISYRTAGLIDTRIARLDRDDPTYDAQVIKAIEEYTIEQSIVKVFGTEALDFVVDEALQMLGGYGYVADYPLERQYRDSRINRIFEGTNEINRLIIPATVMKRVMTQGLPMLAFMQQVEADLASGNGHHQPVDGPLAREIHAVDQAKRLVAYTTRLLLQREPAEIGRQQQHLETFADMIIDLYAMESAVARTAKLIRRRGEEKVKFERDLIAVFLADATERLCGRARRLFGNDTDGHDLARHLANVAQLTPFLPLRVLDARTRIAEHVVGACGVLA